MDKLTSQEINLQFKLQERTQNERAVKENETKELYIKQLENEVHIEKEKSKLMHQFVEKEFIKIMIDHQKIETDLRQQIIYQNSVLHGNIDTIKKLTKEVDVGKCKTVVIDLMKKKLHTHEIEKEELFTKIISQNVIIAANTNHIEELKGQLDIEKGKVFSMHEMEKQLQAEKSKENEDLLSKKEIEINGLKQELEKKVRYFFQYFFLYMKQVSLFD